jgi:hypothetical protein
VRQLKSLDETLAAYSEEVEALARLAHQENGKRLFFMA